MKSYDGNVSLSGELLNFDGVNYLIGTSIGEITVNALQVACEGPGCPDPALLKSEFALKGSDAIGGELVPALVLGYADALEADVVQRRSGLTDGMEMRLKTVDGVDIALVDVDGMSSTSGFDALFAGDATIGMSARQVRTEEANRFAAAGLGNLTNATQERVLALDGVVLVTSPQNPVSTLSEEEIAGIFAGRITNWAEVGGDDLPIVVMNQSRDSATFEAFNELIMAPRELLMTDRGQVFETETELAQAVAADPRAIGFTGFANRRNAKPVGLKLGCGLVARPDSFSVKTEEYPLARRLFLYTTGNPMPPHARGLLEYALSDEAQDIIADAGYVNQSVDARDINNQGLRFAMAFTDPSGEFSFEQMRALALELISAEQLSTTLRFNPGASSLDNKAQQDVNRIVDYLVSSDLRDKEVLLIGFTDSVGRYVLNQALSFRRADQARAAIEAAAPAGALSNVSFKVMGFGELAPVGCNDSLNGRRINRRVEVWIRDRA